MVTFLFIFLTAHLGTQSAHLLILKNHMGNVRVSSLLTLIFIGLTYPLSFSIIPTLHAVFLGSTFVGITDPKHLNRKQLFIASSIFCLIFQFLIVYLKGQGGALGVSALVACLVTFWLGKKTLYSNQ